MAYLDNSLRLLRPGAISLKELRRESGLKILSAHKHPAEVRAPGMLQSHYAPDTPVKTFRHESELMGLLKNHTPSTAGVLFLEPPSGTELLSLLHSRGYVFEVLSESRDLTEAARQLFATLRKLDQQDLSLLFAQVPPQDQGLGQAIRDRLMKAAAPKNLFSV